MKDSVVNKVNKEVLDFYDEKGLLYNLQLSEDIYDLSAKEFYTILERKIGINIKI